MKYLLTLLIALLIFPISAHATQETAPPPPESAMEYMPDEPASFSQGLIYIIKQAIQKLAPSLAEAGRLCAALIAITMALSLVHNIGQSACATVDLAGSLVISVCLLFSSKSMVGLATDSIKELSSYGQLLIPVLSASLAAQGAPTSSAALYTATAVFDSVLSTLISTLLTPLVYVYLSLSVAGSALGENTLKKLRDLSKWLITWSLKILLYIFTGYMAITGVVSGTTDAATMKAAKLTISGAVPVVGNILSDASESVIVGARLIKNSTGIYGLLVIGSLWIGPFLRIGVQYLLLKLTAAVCEVFGTKSTVELIKCFTTAMGLLLAMTGTVCLMLLISIVCFMKGVS